MAVGIGTGAAMGGLGRAPSIKTPPGGGFGVSLRTRGGPGRRKGAPDPTKSQGLEALELESKQLGVEGQGIDVENKKLTKKLNEIKVRAAEREQKMAETLYDKQLEANEAELDSKLSELQRGSMLDFYEAAKLTKQPDGTTLAGELVDESMRWLGGKTEGTVARFYEGEDGEQRLGLFKPSKSLVQGIDPESGSQKITSVDAGFEPVLHEGQPVDFSVEALEALRKETRGAETKEKKTAKVKTVEWLMDNLDVSAQEAWDMANMAKSNPQELAIDLFRKRRSDVEKNLMDESEEQSRAWVERTMKKFDVRGGIDNGGNKKTPQPKSKADYDKLPSGTRFKDPDGNIRVKP